MENVKTLLTKLRAILLIGFNTTTIFCFGLQILEPLISIFEFKTTVGTCFFKFFRNDKWRSPLNNYLKPVNTACIFVFNVFEKANPHQNCEKFNLF